MPGWRSASDRAGYELGLQVLRKGKVDAVAHHDRDRKAGKGQDVSAPLAGFVS